MLNLQKGIIVTPLHDLFVKYSLSIFYLAHCQVAFQYLRKKLVISQFYLVLSVALFEDRTAMIAAITWDFPLQFRVIVELRLL